MFYSKSTRGWYLPKSSMPEDAVEVPQAEYLRLINSRKEIVPNENGYPVTKEPGTLSPEQAAEQTRINRQAAYRDEADPLFFKFQRGDATKSEWLSKIEEIKERFPK